jgi:TM2 domain-containing membrane protein YozV
MKKNPGEAAVLSFLWTGLGQIYNGQLAKGIVTAVIYPLAFYVFVGGVAAVIELGLLPPEAREFEGIVRREIVGLPPPEAGGPRLWHWAMVVGPVAFWVWGIVDAHRTAEQINKS